MSGLEQAALDGTLFNSQPRPSRRRDSLSSASSDSDSEADARYTGKTHTSSSVNRRPAGHIPRQSMYGPATPRRGAQTGPKGVINDHVAHQAAERKAKRASMQATRSAQERSAITAPTVHAEAEIAKKMEGAKLEDEDDEVREWRRKRLEELRSAQASAGLREVGKHGFVGAVERAGWVCVLIYEPDIARCAPLLAEATRIARHGASIVRARAGVLGFGVAGGGRVLASIHERDVSTTLDREDEDEADESDNEVVGVPDPDVLPTLLAYKDGELEKTWVRVDFEVGAEGLEGLLLREGIIARQKEVYDSDEDR